MVQIGDILELTVTETGMNGEGVARHDGLVLFVPLTLVGEIVRVQVKEVKKNFAVARVIKLLRPSPERVEPACPIFYRCGGCEMQHIVYSAHGAIKQRMVQDCMRKASLDCTVDAIVCLPPALGYRNKAQVPFGMQGDRVVVGYFRPGTHDVVPFGQMSDGTIGCPLHDGQINTIVETVRRVVEQLRIPVYSETTHSGIMRHVVVRRVGQAYAVVLVVNAPSFRQIPPFVQALQDAGIEFSLYVSPHCKRTNVIVGDVVKCVHGNDPMTQTVLGVQCAVSPKSFMQINDAVRDAIYLRMRDAVAQFARALVLDAYSGTGITSNLIAPVARKVVAIEIVPDAVRDADEMARRNGNTDKIRNICGDCRVELPRVIAQMGGKYRVADTLQVEHSDFMRLCEQEGTFALADGKTIERGQVLRLQDQESGKYLDVRVQHARDAQGNITVTPINTPILLLDPPRKGCDPSVMQAIAQAAPQAIVYVSCNPATLARDLQSLPDYHIRSVTPYDMFPQTRHVETVAILSQN